MNSKALDVKWCGSVSIPVAGLPSQGGPSCSGCRSLVRQDGKIMMRGPRLDRPPARETLAWYSLVCALPSDLPPTANLSSDAASRLRAVEDYRVVVDQLGFCRRNRE